MKRRRRSLGEYSILSILHSSQAKIPAQTVSISCIDTGDGGWWWWVYSIAEKWGGKIPQIDFHNADLTDVKQIDKVFEHYASDGGIWGVIHLAVSLFVSLFSHRDIFEICLGSGDEGEVA